MAFVPGRKHDLFLSYARSEIDWVESFRKALAEAFWNRTGEQITFWQDTGNIGASQEWRTEIEEAVRNAAVFLAVVSPRYLRSEWCARERAIVLENGVEALRVDTFHRFIKIIKNPDEKKHHEKLLRALQDIRFFPEG